MHFVFCLEPMQLGILFSLTNLNKIWNGKPAFTAALYHTMTKLSLWCQVFVVNNNGVFVSYLQHCTSEKKGVQCSQAEDN